ncbi:MAG: flagellar basal body rod protein FlgB [Verrucomicrobiia bacterium]|jgi:flagellar basal-body rod protein FlgB
MIEALFNNDSYVAAKKMLDATTLRHEAIASNLANLETPNYKRIDVAPSFTAELKQALGSGNADQLAALEPKLEVDPDAVAQSPDGNTVNLETELANLQQNTMAHALETQLVSYQLVRLQMAITGKSA